MPETSRIKWPFPREFEDPWYDSFVAFIEAVDASVYTTREDRSSVLMGGGTVSFNVTGLDGVLTWAQAISLLSPIAGLLINFEPTTVSLLDGEMLYANVTRYPTSSLSTLLQKARSVPNTDDALLLAIRRGNRIYWRNGKVIADGESYAVFEQSAVSGAPVGNALPASVTAGASGTAGVSSSASRQDHAHPVPVGTPVTVTGATNSDGAAVSFARSDHQHRLGLRAQQAGTLVGTRPTLNFIGATVTDDGVNDRVDVTVPGLTGAAPETILPDETGAVGVATAAARADHKHPIAAAAPSDVTADTNSEGASTSFARADHGHRLAMNVLQAAVLVGSRPRINFTGAGVTVTDDGLNDRVNVAIPGGGSTTLIPYIVGKPGTAPGGGTPPFTTITSMIAQMVADGAKWETPKVGFLLPGSSMDYYEENFTLPDGVFLVGLGKDPQSTRIAGQITVNPTYDGDTDRCGLANLIVTPDWAVSPPTHAMHITGFGDLCVYLDNVWLVGNELTGNGLFIDRTADVAVFGTGKDSAIHHQQGISTCAALKMTTGALVEWEGDIIAAQWVGASKAADLSSVSTLRLKGDSYILGQLVVNGAFVEIYSRPFMTAGEPIFHLLNGGSVSGRGRPHFDLTGGSGDLASAGVGGGTWALDSYTVTPGSAGYTIVNSITTQGLSSVHDLYEQTITSLPGTIAPATTLAVVTAGSAGTTTLPPADKRTIGRQLWLVNRSAFSQNFARAGADTIHGSATPIALAPYETALVAVRHGQTDWQILARASVGSAYTLPFFLVGPAGSGPGGSSPFYATIGAAVAAAPTAATIVVMDGTYSENVTLAKDHRVVSWSRYVGLEATAGSVTILGTVTFNPDAAGRKQALNGIRVEQNTSGHAIYITGSNSADIDLTGSEPVAASGNLTDHAVFCDNTSAATRVNGEGLRPTSVDGNGDAYRAEGAAHQHYLNGATVFCGTLTMAAVRASGGALVGLHHAPLITGKLIADGGQIVVRHSTHDATTLSPYRVGASGSITAEQCRVSSTTTGDLVEYTGSGVGTFIYGVLALSGTVKRTYALGVVPLPLSTLQGMPEQTLTVTGTVSESTDVLFLNHASVKVEATLPDPTRRLSRLFYAKNISTGGQAHDLKAVGGTTIEGASSITLSAGTGVVLWAAFGTTDWKVIAVYQPGSSGVVPFSRVALAAKYGTVPGSTSLEKAGGGVWVSGEHDYSGARTIKLRVVLYSPDNTNNVRVKLWSVSAAGWVQNLDGASNDYLQTSSSTPTNISSVDLDGHVNFNAAGTGVYEVWVESTNSSTTAELLSAEFIVG